MNTLTLNCKKIFICILLITISLTAKSQTTDYVPNELLIRWKEKRTNQSTSRTAKKIGLKGEMLKEINDKVEVWKLSVGEKDIATLIQKYKNHPDIEVIEPNYIYHSFEVIPNDPLFSEQWGLKNTGLTNPTVTADIEATAAWEIHNHSSSVQVAIIDSGVDWKHPDLVENIWQNLGEDVDGDGVVRVWNGSEWVFDPDDENGIDDDGNGYIDDFIGWDFRDNDNNPFDLDGHGTHVAGIVGARGNNGLGVSGVTWDVQLVPLRILHRGKLKVSDAIAAINYATRMNIPVSNNSWGGGNYSILLQEAIKDAATKNHLFITAAGNDSLNTDIAPIYPASFGLDNILNVAASDTIDNSANFKIGSSNFGQNSVDLYAPGYRIQSCLPNGTYGSRSGTSMAAPYVTGAYALLKEIFPNKSYLEIKNDILNSVDPIPALNEKCVSGGRLNLFNVLSQSGLNCAYRDSLVLVDLYDSTNGTAWTATWDLEMPISTWYGVILNNDGCVVGVNLGNNNLIGTIPEKIRNLNSIDALILSSNQLHGIIPSSIGRLTNLSHLELNNNYLEGPIPNTIGNSGNLRILYLSSNLLTGTIPLTVGNLKNLIYLQLDNNQLEGYIPNIFENLSGLKRLSLNNNKLEGGFPYSFSKLRSLEWLFLNDNQLIGRPFYIENLSKLKKIRLDNNQFSGPLPSIGYLTLQEINFSRNQFIGCFPKQFSSLCNIAYDFSENPGLPSGGIFFDFCNNSIGECANCSREVDSLALVDLYNSTDGPNWNNTWNLSTSIDTWHGIETNEDGCVNSISLLDNNLIGNLPSTIGNLANLEYLDLYKNQLTGEIPISIGNLKKLIGLNIGSNKLDGLIPTQITNLTGLTSLDLHSNQLTGSIPLEIGQLKGLRSLKLDRNQLIGEIPATIGQLKVLRELLLYTNRLAEIIPIEIFKMESLEYLYLNNNDLTGIIPSEIENLINLKSLGLANNQLIGGIPKEIASLDALVSLYLSKNKLTGLIPTKLGDLTNLEVLDLDDNGLTGSIPIEIFNCSNLYTLRLSKNQLTGQIHPAIINLSNLHILTINDNDLSGCIPKSLLTFCDRSVSVNLLNNPRLSNGHFSDFCRTQAGMCTDPVYPGDFNNDGIANKEDVLYWALAYPNNTGAQRPNATTDWYGQEAPNWGVTVKDIDSKHQDGDGNGIIDTADLTVLKTNYGKTHGYRPFNEITNGISYELATNNIIGDTLQFAIKLNGGNGSVSLHGISISIDFGSLGIDTIIADFSNSALNPSHNIVEYDSINNILDIALTRTDQQDTICDGEMGQFSIVVLDLLELDDEILIAAKNGNMIKANGELNAISGAAMYSTYSLPASNTNLVASISASTVACDQLGSAMVAVNGGTTPYTYQWNTGATTAAITDLTEGTYQVTVSDANGLVRNFSVDIEGRYTPVYDENGELIDCHPTDCQPNLVLANTFTTKTYQAANSIQASGTVTASDKVVFKAGDHIILQPGFTVEAGGTLLAAIEDCSEAALDNNTNTSQFKSIQPTKKIKNITAAPINSTQKPNVFINPNPLYQQTVFTYQLPIATQVQLSITDLQGTQLRLIEGAFFKEAGVYQIPFDALHLAKGLYFVRLQTNEAITTEKMIVLD